MKKISLQDIEAARGVVCQVAHKTPLELSRSSSERVGAKVFLKFENTQFTGSFKIRGALNKISSLDEAEKKHGIVASSAGNHAQGVAFSSKYLGINAQIVMPETTPLVKVMATKGYGAEVILNGDVYDRAYERAREIEREEGRVFVHPYQDPLVIAGQGTIGLEILEDLPDLDSIVIPIGGGGLISGIATAIKAKKPDCRIIGIQSKAASSMVDTFNNKMIPKETKILPTIADGIAVKKPSEEIYESYIKNLVDDVASVTDEEIAEAIVFLMERAKTVVEGAGAVGMAAALSAKLNLGEKTCILLSGGNIDMNIIAKVVEKGLHQHGRWSSFRVAVEDRPGVLWKLAKAIAETRANILQVNHERGLKGLYLGETSVKFTLETNSWEHLDQVKKTLKDMGCRIISEEI